MIINRHISETNQLQELIFRLGLPCISEHSIKVLDGVVLSNRRLYSLHKHALGEAPNVTLADIYSHISIPQQCVELLDMHLNDADNIHFGVEESDKGVIYKIYLEFADRYRRAMESGEFNDSGVLVFLACKWNPEIQDSSVITHYRSTPSVTISEISNKISLIYRHCESGIPLDIASGFLTFVANKMATKQILFTEVKEENNPRCSYDINVYDLGLMVADIEPCISSILQHFNIPENESNELYAGIKDKELGHLAGGVDRENRAFFSVYFGLEIHQGAEPCEALSPELEQHDPVEISLPEDRYFDYCLWEYQPLCSTQNKYRAINLLYNSFDVAGSERRMVELTHTIRDSIGSFKTVWGVKQCGGTLNWEYYFYDYDRQQRQVSIETLQEVIRPYAPSHLSSPETTPYFMFSIDIDNQLVSGQRELDEINVYIGNAGSTVSSGLCYALNCEGMALTNLYCFFDAATQMDEIATKVLCSVYLEPSLLNIDDILWPELISCKTIVVANKQGRDGVYFSRVEVDQLLFFLKKMDYPETLIAYLENNRQRFDHLLYDVGIDYTMKDGKLIIVKSAYYGVF